MSDDPTPKDPKAELEDRLVKRAMEPYAKTLDADEQAGMEILLDLFVKSHPVMQRMVVQRIAEDTAIEATKATAETESAPNPPLVAESGTVTKDSAETTEPRGGDASGIVAKGGAASGAKGKAGGEP